MRKLTFDGKTNEMTLKETYELSEFVKPTDMHFITTLEKVEKTELGKVKLSKNQTSLNIEYDEKMFDFAHEQKPCSDTKLEHDWANMSLD